MNRPCGSLFGLMKSRVLALALLVVTGCRDEQAGPKPKGAPPPQQQQPGQPPAQAGASQVRSLDALPPQVQLTFKSDATWAQGAVSYVGTIVEPNPPQAGQQMRLTHILRANKTPPPGWKFFVHVVDAATGQMVVNADHDVQQGNAPLSSWPIGKLIPDQHVVQLPDYQQPMRVVLGFWQDDQRLPIDQPDASDGTGRMLGPKLSGAAGPPLPEYAIKKTAKKPTIDGKLDDAVWQQATAVTLTASFDGHEVQRKTKLRMLYDDTNVYVSFDCEDPDVWGTLLKKDDPIYNEEAVEVFFDADGDGATYNELQVSPHNVNFDASFVSRRSDLPEAMKWESGMKTAVQVRGTLDKSDDVDEGWSVEMEIPIASLNKVPHVPPQKGDVWRFNAYRLEHFVHAKQIEGQSFSPLFMGDFHHLPRFGKLIFEG